MNYMIIFDIVILALGIYELYAALKMKRENKISTLYVAEAEITKCSQPDRFIQFLFPKTIIFGFITMLFGVEGLVDDLLLDLGTPIKVVAIVVFIGAWGWFSYELRKGKKEMF